MEKGMDKQQRKSALAKFKNQTVLTVLFILNPAIHMTKALPGRPKIHVRL
uniref:Uncharacterized protein n=1 Tax=Anguilla anguilla TaxID=7936 RepID=A0A0E9PVW7_ANGAN